MPSIFFHPNGELQSRTGHLHVLAKKGMKRSWYISYRTDHKFMQYRIVSNSFSKFLKRFYVKLV